MPRSCELVKSVIGKLTVAFAIFPVLVGVAACGIGTAQQLHADPPKFSNLEQTLNIDLTKVDSDLAGEVGDAAAGANGAPGQPACYNLVNNVNFDVLKVIDNFIEGTVMADVASTQDDINTIRQDVANFQADIADFANDGVPGPAGSPQTISAMKNEIRRFIKAINGTITKINADVHRAYIIADGLATRPCSGDRPEDQTAQPVIPPVQ